jgi:hypothetical protein
MDYRTGVSGQKRRLSEQMFREELYIAPTRGRHESGSPTRQKVRSLVDRLVSVGAIDPIGPLVFQLPNAEWDGPSKTSATDEQPDQQPDQQPKEEPENPNESGHFPEHSQASATVSESADLLISNLPPVSGGSKALPPPTRARSHDHRTRFAMSATWLPDEKSFPAVLAMNGMGGQVYNLDQLNEFRSFWCASPDEYRTQAKWEHAFAMSLKKQLRVAQANGRPAHGHTQIHQGRCAKTNQRGTRQGPMSAPERVRAAIAEREAREAAAGPDGQALDQDGRDVRPPLDVEFWRVS